MGSNRGFFAANALCRCYTFRMVRATVLIAVSLASARAMADTWATACRDHIEQAWDVYMNEVGKTDFARWDFASRSLSSDKRAVRLHTSWRNFDYSLAVTLTSASDRAWHARWVHGEWWFERVAHGRLASIHAAGVDGIRDRAQFAQAFQP